MKLLSEVLDKHGWRHVGQEGDFHVFQHPEYTGANHRILVHPPTQSWQHMAGKHWNVERMGGLTPGGDQGPHLDSHLTAFHKSNWPKSEGKGADSSQHDEGTEQFAEMINTKGGKLAANHTAILAGHGYKLHEPGGAGGASIYQRKSGGGMDTHHVHFTKDTGYWEHHVGGKLAKTGRGLQELYDHMTKTHGTSQHSEEEETQQFNESHFQDIGDRLGPPNLLRETAEQFGEDYEAKSKEAAKAFEGFKTAFPHKTHSHGIYVGHNHGEFEKIVKSHGGGMHIDAGYKHFAVPKVVEASFHASAKSTGHKRGGWKHSGDVRDDHYKMHTD